MLFKIFMFLLFVFSVFYFFGDSPVIKDINSGITGYVTFLPNENRIYCSDANTTCMTEFMFNLRNCIESSYVIDSAKSTVYYSITRAKYFCDVSEKYKFSDDERLAGKFQKCGIPYDMTESLLNDFQKVKKYCYGNIGSEGESSNQITG